MYNTREEICRRIRARQAPREHQLGLPLDINAEYDDDFAAMYQWPRENCSRYGFILRNPAEIIQRGIRLEENTAGTQEQPF